MTHIRFFSTYLLLLIVSTVIAQNRPTSSKIKVTGTIIDKISQKPLEYATITLTNTNNPKMVSGGITDAKGQFEATIPAGTYNIKAEFISFKSFQIQEKVITQNTNLGAIALEEDFTQLKQVEVRAQKTYIDIKLDKKVYTVGQDLIVKGGTVSDVLDNIPSVAVDVEGKVSLRGNENVTILIDGKPSNAVNITEALRIIPADNIDKVEVITNPSARYDAEGGGGILNIILKKGKNQGFNGSVIISAGEPENTGVSGNFNIKNENSNFFTNIGYAKRDNPGNFKIDQENFDNNRTLISTVKERRNNNRYNEGFNGNFGMEIFIDKSSSWTNTLSLRKNKGGNPENVTYAVTSVTEPFEKTQRFNDVKRANQNAEYSTSYIKRFKRDGHKLTIDGVFSVDTETESSGILGTQISPTFEIISSERSANKQKQSRNTIQSDYIRPFNEQSQFEVGVRGNYLTLLSDFKVEEDLDRDGTFTINPNFTNILEYKENVSAAYTQIGSKFGKFSVLAGLRFEYSNIHINQLTLQDFTIKNYSNLFPSAFITYELNSSTNLSVNYSRRINRPRDRFINPFSTYSSNVNFFVGNPDLDPSLSDVVDLGLLKKWKSVTLSTSLYVNQTDGNFQIVRKETGNFVNGIPVIFNTPFNLATDERIGFEFTLNYTPYKWLRLNGNFNYFANKTDGKYTYRNSANELKTIDFYNTSSTWFTRITSKISFPNKIDFQVNGTYNAPQQIAQGKSVGVGSMNLALSKDILKDKGTIAFNVSDVFNSRKRIMDLSLPNVDSYSEMQWRERQITLSFTYRFNKQKSEREKPRREEGNEDFQG